MMPVDGVSTYLALTFGTLLSSQGTDASFGPVSPGPPGASLRCSTTLSGRFGLSIHPLFRRHAETRSKISISSDGVPPPSVPRSDRVLSDRGRCQTVQGRAGRGKSNPRGPVLRGRCCACGTLTSYDLRSVRHAVQDR
ncbi:hypothetical protein FMM49_36230 [Streptomyces rimosus subsp. rimosus]|nr:hypothetical protein CTZ40_35705 [Streptomyces rimosus]QEV79578.1 hypothetical protein CP984_35670 [Streptomyces rimosus]QTL90438.1 hypothetical protein FMM49_36230 [Streptomyces rimosus subsp. rimosus]